MRPFLILLLTLLMPCIAVAHQSGTSSYLAHIRADERQVDTLVTFPGRDAAEILLWDFDQDGQIGADELLPRLDALGRYVSERLTVEADGKPCEVIEEKAGPANQALDAYWYMKAFRCPSMGTVTLSNLVMNQEGYTHVGKVQLDERVFTTTFTPASPSYTVEISSPGPEFDVLAFILLGFEHILGGVDHVLFVLLLVLLAPRFRTLLAVVTSFTLAHSVTLALATLNVIAVSPSVVEPLIALSIVVLAVETTMRTDPPKYLVAITFAFGLLHGLGFSYVLRDDVGLPKDDVGAALLTFNVGVELGQILIVALTFPIRRWICEKPWERRAIQVISVAIGALALYWTIQRIWA